MTKIFKKHTFLFLSLLGLLAASQQLHSQTVSTPASPSVSSYGTYLDSPADIYTGIPDIGYDLISLPTRSKTVSFNMALRYHPNNIASYESVSDVGKGWSLFGAGVISRTINGASDDQFTHTPIPQNYNPFDDEYNYDFNGNSGKFKFLRDTLTGTFSILNLKPNRLKFEFTNTASVGLKVGTITITDGNGIRYHFADFNFSNTNKTVLHLTTISESNGTVIASLEYEEIYKKLNTLGNISELILKLKKINAVGYGQIEMEFTKNLDYLNAKFDMAQINSLSLKNVHGALIKKCKLTYFTGRILTKLELCDKNQVAVDKYEFEYNGSSQVGTPDYYGYNYYVDPCDVGQRLRGNAQSAKLGVLEKVKLPTGGYIKYDFEPHTTNHIEYATSELFFRNYNTDDEFDEAKFSGQGENSYSFVTDPDSFIVELDVNPLNKTYDLIGAYNFDTHNDGGTSGYFFNITESAKYAVIFSSTPYPAGQLGDTPYVSYSIRQGNTVIGTGSMDSACFGKKVFTLAPGSYVFTIHSNYGGHGTYAFYKETPVVEFKRWSFGGGLRIKNISYFTDTSAIEPSKTVSYAYDDFDEPRNSSGQALIEKALENEKMKVKVFYKNVKVTQGTGNGHVKYYYHSPFDRQEFTPKGAWKNFTVFYQGLLNFSETVDSQGRIVKKDKFYYEIAQANNLSYLYFPGTQGTNINVTTDYIVKSYVKTSLFSFNPSTVITEKSLSITDPINYKIKSQVSFNSDGQKNRVNYFYPHNLPNEANSAALQAKNMTGAVLKTEKMLNGDKLSEEKAIYRNWGNNFLAPEFSQTSKGIESLETKIRYNLLDNTNGNVLEIQQENGMKISYIWGYNKTHPVAKIENMAYASIPANLITSIQTASDSNNVETQLLAALNSLRNAPQLANTMVTTYTYIPLVGISTSTDPKGDYARYVYDDYGRLKAVYDRNGNLLSENEYHFRTQN